MPVDGPLFFQPVHEFHRAVVLNEEPSGDLANGGLGILGKSVNRQQELMLLGLDAALSRRRFTEVQELPDLPPKLRQIAILALR